jgi:hypothetical protein
LGRGKFLPKRFAGKNFPQPSSEINQEEKAAHRDLRIALFRRASGLRQKGNAIRCRGREKIQPETPFEKKDGSGLNFLAGRSGWRGGGAWSQFQGMLPPGQAEPR